MKNIMEILNKTKAELAESDAKPSICDQLEVEINRYLKDKCADKPNYMEQIGEGDDCPCSGGVDASGGVDLVVLIDSSGSMGTAAGIISDVAENAFKEAVESCGAVAQVTYLYVDGSDSGSNSAGLGWVGIFDTSHERHLIDVAGATGPFAADGDGKLDREQGGKAIADLSNHNNWKDGFCRAILYISDENLDSSDQPEAASLAAANIAIAAANANNVTIFAHHFDVRGPVIHSHYQMMADQTGGSAVFSNSSADISSDLYVEIISSAICNGCGSVACATADLPDIVPCVHINWGDSDCDYIEGDDHEELCISICNCYSNVTFQNVRISAIVVTDSSGAFPPTLPDGSPSSAIYPLGPYCFGDIGPCVDDEANCVSRNAMIINRGLPAGSWKVSVFGLCFDVCYHNETVLQDFAFDVCKN